MTTPDARPPETPAEPRSGWVTALLFVTGLILLLPGLCAIFFSFVALQEKSGLGYFVPFIGLGLAIGAGGLVLIRKAWRR
ncbi:hypothetical protein SSBR45G_18940 [Bradyrhizobium sp. SSBR45G]|uniref:hypothetical protein n=1 Tax=unclassified Bradyrhizobium TaxID=2631580 RepID=UPI002342B4C4|nr:MULTISPECIES: hypothetical protein [unclassified Bradyrhizobium]GLH76986.1 hypothetical protein SSBR45G_18940 [Bradyrhizobium sp. SSBR45G]GLH83744.1 hypothetical protein SSBR45R_12040 [Bradyrhizobium sp. SSBR45R]